MKKNIIISLILNIIIIIMEMIGIITCFISQGLSMFQYYTEISNILTLIVSVVLVVYIIINFKKNKIPPKWIGLCRYIVTVSLLVTFLVVLFILIPTMQNIGIQELLFGNSTLYHHTLCPIISFISFIFFEKYNLSGWKDALYGISLTIIYAVFSIIFNVLRIMTGPYPFLLIYNQPIYVSVIWFICIIGGSYMLAIMIQKLLVIKNKYNLK